MRMVNDRDCLLKGKWAGKLDNERQALLNKEGELTQAEEQRLFVLEATIKAVRH